MSIAVDNAARDSNGLAVRGRAAWLRAAGAVGVRALVAAMRACAASAVCLLAATAAHAAVDPGVAAAPRTDFAPPRPGTYQLHRIQQTPDAELLDASGRARHLAELTHGKITVLTFFYTSCADPLGCPFGYVTLTQLRSRLIKDAGLAQAVRFVNISLDPLNDTPAAMREYAGRLGDDPRFEWSFLTARSIARLLPVLDDFGQDVSVQTDRRGQATGVLHHMLKVFLIDGSGGVREIYSLDFLQPEVMLSDIQTLVLEKPLAQLTSRNGK